MLNSETFGFSSAVAGRVNEPRDMVSDFSFAEKQELFVQGSVRFQ